MASSQDALACAIVRSHFGDIAAETVRILLAAPGSPLREVARDGSAFCDKKGLGNGTRAARKARYALFRDSLAVLLQHAIANGVERNLSAVSGAKGGKKNVRKTDVRGAADGRSTNLQVYYICKETIFFRIRLPLYLGAVRRSYGDVGEAAVRAYFERGRLTTHQVFTAVLDPLLAQLGITSADAEACLSDMAKSGLMHWHGKRRLNGLGEDSDNSDDDVPIAARTQVGQKRARSPDRGHDMENGKDVNYSNGRGEETESIAVGRGNHRIVVGAPTRANDQDVWGICFRHLNREFRNECCALVVGLRIRNELSLRILRAGLQLALDEEDCQIPSDDFETSEIDTHTIQMQLADQDGSIRDQDFWEAVTALVQQTPAVVVGIPENAPTKLRFIPGQLVSDARQQTLDDLIASRYGPIGRRVFRALAIDGGMEDKMIAQKCMLPIKVAREHLFRMYQDRMVAMQDVPRSHEQTRSSNWYYLWHVNPMSVYRAMMEIMYKTVLNLFLRMQHVEGKQALSDAERKQKEIHRELLMGSITRMDQSVMVMRDFGPVTASYLPSRYLVIDGLQGKPKKKR